MKRLRTTLIGLLLLPVAAWSQTVAVLDVENAVRASQPAQAFRDKLKEEFAVEEQHLRNLSEEGNALKSKADKEGDFMSKEARQKLGAQIQAKYQEFQQYGQQLQSATKAREQEFLKGLKPDIEKIVQKLVEERDIDILLTKKAAVFVKPDLDLTPLVIERINASSK